MVTCTLFLASWGHLDFLRSTLTGKMFLMATMMMFDKREGLHDLKDNPRTFPKYFFNLSATVVSKGWLMFYSLIWCDMLWCGIIIVLYSSIENARWSVKVQARVVSGSWLMLWRHSVSLRLAVQDGDVMLIWWGNDDDDNGVTDDGGNLAVHLDQRQRKWQYAYFHFCTKLMQSVVIDV